MKKLLVILVMVFSYSTNTQNACGVKEQNGNLKKLNHKICKGCRSNDFILQYNAGIWVYPADNKIRYGENGYSERHGNEITYSWQLINTEGMQNFATTFNIGYDFEQMQSDYKHIEHQHIYPSKVYGDPYLGVVKKIADVIKWFSFENDVDPVTMALSFVQALPYQSNMGSYQRYASETLVDGIGDCSDTSVLFAAILKILGYECVFIEYPNHLIVGVRLNDGEASGTYFTYGGDKYYVCETTGWGYKVGEDSEEEYSTGTIIPCKF